MREFVRRKVKPSVHSVVARQSPRKTRTPTRTISQTFSRLDRRTLGLVEKKQNDFTSWLIGRDKGLIWM